MRIKRLDPEYREKMRLYVKEWRRKNPEKFKESIRKSQAKKPELYRKWRKEYDKTWSVENREKKREYAFKSYWKDPEKARIRVGTYRKLNKDKVLSYMKKYRKESGYFEKRYKTDIQYRLAYLLRRRLRSALKGNTKKGSAVKLLGCSVAQLKFHIEGKFQERMSWDNWGEWHIDHVVPLSFFDLTNEQQLASACHYTNLQPLWADENIRKGGINRIKQYEERNSKK